MKLKNRSSFHAGFFCFYVFFLYVLLQVLAFSRELLFFIYLSRLFIIFFLFFIYTSVLFLLLYISHALSYFLFFIFYLLSPMRSLVLSSVREKGYLGFVCCFSAFSSISAFFSCFLFSFFTKVPFLLSPLSSFLFLAKRLHFFFHFFLAIL